MKLRLQLTRLAGGREVIVEADRGASSREQLKWAVEREHRFGMALEAIRAEPDAADEIARRALDEAS